MGKVVIRELHKEGEKWTGKLLIGKSDNAYDIELQLEGKVLGVVVHADHKQEQARWPRAKE